MDFSAAKFVNLIRARIHLAAGKREREIFRQHTFERRRVRFEKRLTSIALELKHFLFRHAFRQRELVCHNNYRSNENCQFHRLSCSELSLNHRGQLLFAWQIIFYPPRHYAGPPRFGYRGDPPTPIALWPLADRRWL